MEKILVWNCGDDLPNAEQEVKDLENLRPHCEVITAPPSLGWDDLSGLASAVKPTIFHFIGHGDRTGHLMVRGFYGLPAADVIRVVRVASPNLKGVYLSACFSATDGPELLDSLPPAGGWAIGTGLAVDDDLAVRFSERFYQHLVRNSNQPRDAYNLAHAYVVAEWGAGDVSHSAWFNQSRLPTVDNMVRNIDGAIRGIFSRPAFRMPMREEGSITELEDALQDVSHALGTGEVRSRQHGTVITPSSFPPEWLQDPEVEKFVVSAIKGIVATREALATVKAGAIGDRPVIGNHLSFNRTATEDEWMKRLNKVDRTRNQVLNAANKLFIRGEVSPLTKIEISYTKREIDEARPSTS